MLDEGGRHRDRSQGGTVERRYQLEVDVVAVEIVAGRNGEVCQELVRRGRRDLQAKGLAAPQERRLPLMKEGLNGRDRSAPRLGGEAWGR